MNNHVSYFYNIQFLNTLKLSWYLTLCFREKFKRHRKGKLYFNYDNQKNGCLHLLGFPLWKMSPSTMQKDHWAIWTQSRRTKVERCNKLFVITYKEILNKFQWTSAQTKIPFRQIWSISSFLWSHASGLNNDNNKLVIFMIVFHYYASPTSHASIFSPHMPTTWMLWLLQQAAKNHTAVPSPQLHPSQVGWGREIGK